MIQTPLLGSYPFLSEQMKLIVKLGNGEDVIDLRLNKINCDFIDKEQGRDICAYFNSCPLYYSLI
jgi:hypothetical protein